MPNNPAKGHFLDEPIPGQNIQRLHPPHASPLGHCSKEFRSSSELRMVSGDRTPTVLNSLHGLLRNTPGVQVVPLGRPADALVQIEGVEVTNQAVRKLATPGPAPQLIPRPGYC